jgi:hypothetical protein
MQLKRILELLKTQVLLLVWIKPPPPSNQGLGAGTRGFEPLDPTKILEQTETLYSGLYGKGTGAAAPGDKIGYVQKAEDFFKAAGVNLDMAAQQAAEIAAEKEALGKDREEAKNMRIVEAGLCHHGGDLSKRIREHRQRRNEGDARVCLGHQGSPEDRT